VFQDGVKRTISSGAVSPGTIREGFGRKRPTAPPSLSPQCKRALTGPAAAPPRRSTGEIRPGRHWSPSVPFQQFQALFDSFFKVLCIFPSRYLFAIGLPPLFSLRWNLPPSLSCNPKQLDSSLAGRARRPPARNGVITLHDALFQGTWTGDDAGATTSDYNSSKGFTV
jgi:hypothetical protein